MYKKLSSFLLVLTFSISNLCFFTHNANAAELTEKDKKFAPVLYKAWKEIDAYSNSRGPLKITIHAGKNIDKKFIDEWRYGVESVVTKFSNFLKPTDEFHLIFASNYEDAEKLILEVNQVFPGYSSYNTTHLKRAKDFFSKPKDIIGGSTSSRGCWHQNSPYGPQNSISLNPCPKLSGGVTYLFGEDSALLMKYGHLDVLGGHEAFHDILSIINPNSHWNNSEWLIEGTVHTIGLAVATNKKNLGSEGTLLFPYPNAINVGPFDLSLLDSNSMPRDEIYTVGVLAVSLLISKFGFPKYMEFITNMGFPIGGKNQLTEYFGISKDDFYKEVSDFTEWYSSNGWKIIERFDFEKGDIKKMEKTTITCIKGKTSKKVTGVNPKCPAGYTKK